MNFEAPRRTLIVLALLILASHGAPAEGKVEKLTFESGGRTRTYYAFVPEKAAAGSAPVLLLLHGSGRNGKSLVDPWVSVAKSEGIILVAPDAVDSRGWNMPRDAPEPLYDLLESVRRTYHADPRRMYLFGHSAGARLALKLAILESEYFAAVAVHAGALDAGFAPFLDRAPRKTPIAIWIGTNDAFFPVDAVRATRDALVDRGFAAELTEMRGHTHDYYGRAGDINKQAWKFLQGHQLDGYPSFQPYDIR